MDIQYWSDLHLEFASNRDYLAANALTPSADLLLLAGDIIPFQRMKEAMGFFDFVSDSFEQVYWVPGNHEYYRSDINHRTGEISERIRSNVSLVNNVSVEHKGVRLVFSTLWTRISPEKESVITRGMADFHLITDKDKKLSASRYNGLHEKARDFLLRELQIKRPRTIVVSHHVPTFYNYPEKYAESDLNQGFAVELYDLVADSNADFWISGHTHEVVSDFTIGSTVLTSNQLGYVDYNEHLNFRPGKVLTL
ncbi:MAG TPA: metallophosphoesterase [Chryseosolibacter sp.]|nr:metallophosphoesterase [Chryseosolibacter sp.]